MQSKNPLMIGLYNPKSPSNVGSVLRAAGCYGAAGVRYTGERFDRAAKYHTDTNNSIVGIPLVHVDELQLDVSASAKIVCVELAEGATSLPSFSHPEQALYIFGPEDGSLPQALINQAHEVVYVPTIGCMNLAATVNVVLYDRLAKSKAKINHDERIKASRDSNNRLRVGAP